jgi:flagellar motility protein MotE (MotC chaperone)
MSDKEVEVNGKKYGENSRVTLKASTLMWIIGGLISVISTLATVGYFDIKNDVEESKEMYDQGKQEYKEEMRKLIKEELKYERDKRDEMKDDISEIKGDIKVILEKTRNLENSSSATPVNRNYILRQSDTLSTPSVPHHSR